MTEKRNDLAQLVKKNFGVSTSDDLLEILHRIISHFRIPYRKSNLSETKSKGMVYASKAYTLERACELTGKSEGFFRKIMLQEKISYLEPRGELLIPGFELMRVNAWPDASRPYTPQEISQKYGIGRNAIEDLATIHASNKKPLLAKDNGKITSDSLLNLYQTLADYKTLSIHKHPTGRIPEEQYIFYKREGQRAAIKSGKTQKKGLWAFQNIINAFSGYFEGLDKRFYYLFKFDIQGSEEAGIVYVTPHFLNSNFRGDDIQLKFAELFRRFKSDMDEKAKAAHFLEEGIMFVEGYPSDWYFGGMYTTKKKELEDLLRTLRIQAATTINPIVRNAVSHLKSLDDTADASEAYINPLKRVLIHVVNLYRRDYERSRSQNKLP